MANLSAILKQYQMNYKPISDATIAGINANYAGQSAANNKIYGNSLSQANQTLAQVPSQFNAQRNAADETKNQAMDLLPTNLANSGAAADSGANYVARTNVGNQFQGTMGTIGTAQNTAKQAAQNNISTLTANEAADQAKLSASRASDLASARTTALNNILSNGYSQYNTDQAREATEAANAASLAAQKQEAADNLAYKKAAAAASGNAAAEKLLNSQLNRYIKTINTSSTKKSGLGSSSTTKSTTSATHLITNPDALLSAIYNSGLTPQQQINYISSIQYHTSTGQSLADYAVNGSNMNGTGYGPGDHNSAKNNAPHRH